jgi:hypothetical protein
MLLLKSTSELKANFSRLQASATFATFESFIEDAQQKYIVPLIGQESVDALLDWYTPYDGETEDQDLKNLLLLARVQKALTFYTLFEASISMLLDFGDLGIQEKTNDRTMAARIPIVNSQREQFANNADVAAEALLAFLETNKAWYSFWEDSDFRKASIQLFIENGLRLNRYIRMTEPRRFYLNIQPQLSRVEEMDVQEILGQSLYESVKAEMEGGTETAETLALIKVIRPFVAFRAVAEALPEMVVTLSSAGMKVSTASDNMFQSSTGTGISLTKDQLSVMLQKYVSMADSYEAALKKFLNENAADYPDFPVPTEATARAAEASLPDNASKKSFRL